MEPPSHAEDERATAFFQRYPSRKLNLGSGADVRDGYTNIDMHDYGRPNTMVGDITDLSDLPSGNFDEIVAQDILEHIRFSETPAVLFEWNRLLAVGGRLFVRSTYLNGLVRLFEKPQHQSIRMQLTLLTNLFSRQLVPGDFHLTAFTEPLMRFYMWAAMFEIDQIAVRDEWIFEVWATKTRDVYPPDLLLSSADDADFVRAAYAHILGREADPHGAGEFTRSLRGGATRGQILKALVTSAEYQERLVATAPVFALDFYQPRD